MENFIVQCLLRLEVKILNHSQVIVPANYQHEVTISTVSLQPTTVQSKNALFTIFQFFFLSFRAAIFNSQVEP